jgi:hypothetical protein
MSSFIAPEPCLLGNQKVLSSLHTHIQTHTQHRANPKAGHLTMTLILSVKPKCDGHLISIIYLPQKQQMSVQSKY